MSKLIDLGIVSEETKGQFYCQTNEDGGTKFNCPSPLLKAWSTDDSVNRVPDIDDACKLSA